MLYREYLVYIMLYREYLVYTILYYVVWVLQKYEMEKGVGGYDELSMFWQSIKSQ